MTPKYKRKVFPAFKFILDRRVFTAKCLANHLDMKPANAIRLIKRFEDFDIARRSGVEKSEAGHEAVVFEINV